MLHRQLVTAPNGDRWQVGRRWTSGRARTRRRRARREQSDGGGKWFDAADLLQFGSVNSLEEIPLAILLAVGVAVFVLLLLPLLGIALELAAVLALFASGIFGRVFLRRPWTIEALNLDRPEQAAVFHVTGWRRSRRTLRALGDALRTTGLPSQLPEATAVSG